MTEAEQEVLLSEVRGGLRGFDSLPDEMLGSDGGRRVATQPDSATLFGRDAWLHRLEHMMDRGDEAVGDAALDGRDAWVAHLGAMSRQLEQQRQHSHARDSKRRLERLGRVENFQIREGIILPRPHARGDVYVDRKR